MDVHKIIFVPGAVFAAFLIGPRQTALLPSRALNYNPRTQLWEKRLIRYYSYLWRCQSRRGDYQKPLLVSTIFREGLGIEIDTRLLARQKKHLAKSLRTLQRDGAIGSWRYDRQDGPWSEWTIIIEPTAELLKHYGPQLADARGLTATTPLITLPKQTTFYSEPRYDNAELVIASDFTTATPLIASSQQPALCCEPSVNMSIGQQIRAKRENLRLSQSKLAQQLKLSQAIISRVESGRAPAPTHLRKWLEAS